MDFFSQNSHRNFSSGMAEDPSNSIDDSFSPPYSYFTIPSGLLDSPVLLHSSTILPSPTTGTFSAGVLPLTPKNNSCSSNYQHNNIKQENMKSSSTLPNNTSDDGFNWRKYGQKQVKGSENPRSYYKCTFPNCPVKKQVEKSLDGQIIEIVYKSKHNHPQPESTRKSASSSSSLSLSVAFPQTQTSYCATNVIPEYSLASHGSRRMDSITTPENASIVDDDLEQVSMKKSKLGTDEFDEDEHDAKRWRREIENEGISAAGNKTVRDQRVVVQTISKTDKLDDGYWWRKYGQKVVKGNPNPRSYYKCTYTGCPVRKHIERASHDLRAVITTYEGKHSHDVPAARGSGKPLLNHYRNSINAAPSTTTTVKPSPMPMVSYSNNASNDASFRDFPSLGSYLNQSTLTNVFSRTEECAISSSHY